MSAADHRERFSMLPFANAPWKDDSDSESESALTLTPDPWPLTLTRYRGQSQPNTPPVSSA